MSFYDARSFCGYQKSDLVLMSSKEMQKDVENLILNETRNLGISLTDKAFWIGLYKANHEYRWLQNLHLPPSNKVIPDTSYGYYPCVIMRFNITDRSWSWFSVNCASVKAYPVCRRIIGSKQGIISDILHSSTIGLN